jgi:hypothetical protein
MNYKFLNPVFITLIIIFSFLFFNNYVNTGNVTETNRTMPFTLTVDAGLDTTIYLGYGDETAILTATASGGTPPYTYLWSNNATTQSITVSPTITKSYTVIVTDADTNTAYDSVMVYVTDIRCGGRSDSVKVLVCHNVNNNPHTICINSHAVLAHLNHGDYLGNCDTLTIITSQEQPAEFKLYANYPNPFNPVTNIRFSLPQTSHAKLTIYDVLGNEVATLTNEELKVGSYLVSWNATGYSSGVYFYKLISNEFTDVKKMILLK